MSEASPAVPAVRGVIAEVIRPSHFIALSPLSLEWEHVSSETTPWEIYRGQLMQPHLTRQTRTLESWNVFGADELGRSSEPLLSVKFDVERDELHVVRGLLCFVWEGYDSGDNVYLSREVQRWVRELVGTLRLDQAHTEEDFRAKLSMLLFRAVVGTSRLPLTSLEAPLPAWSLGRLAYFHENTERLHDRNGRDGSLAFAALSKAELAPKALEWLLRSTPDGDLPEAVEGLTTAWTQLGKSPLDTCRLLRSLFNDVSLSPYTAFVDKTLQFLRLLVDRKHLTPEQQIDFLGWLLRQLARHLTAYDLFTFHHRGANYPDALLLDAVLYEFLRLLEEHPALFEHSDRACQLRRRALRLAWLHRRRYEGHPVPDSPTSPGENLRVLPPPHVRVPEEQILNLLKRRKRLYADDPLPHHAGPHGQRMLQQCGHDLSNADELRELGMAIFIERPLGSALAAGEPDASPLLAHEAYSRSLAERALAELAREPLLGLTAEDVEHCKQILAQPWPQGGLPVTALPSSSQRVVSLADAAKAAQDFVILRTLPGSVRAFCEWNSMAKVLEEKGIDLNAGGAWLIVATASPTGQPGVLIRDVMGEQVVQLVAKEIVACAPG